VAILTVVTFFILNESAVGYWLTRPRLSCHIIMETIFMQLGQLQPAFANREKSSVGRVVRHVMSRI